MSVENCSDSNRNVLLQSDSTSVSLHSLPNGRIRIHSFAIYFPNPVKLRIYFEMTFTLKLRYCIYVYMVELVTIFIQKMCIISKNSWHSIRLISVSSSIKIQNILFSFSFSRKIPSILMALYNNMVYGISLRLSF